MGFVSRNFNVLTFKDMQACIRSNALLPDRPLIITFDDGYADNYDNAFPILKKYGLNAVFFITTDYIGGTKPFWFENLIYLSKKGLLDYRKIGIREFISSSCNASERIKQFRLYLMKLQNRERLDLLKKIINDDGIIIPQDELDHVRLLNWDQVKEMADAGMEIGSHTRSHLILGKATEEKLRDELQMSKMIIEEKIGESVISISYPMASREFVMTPKVLQETRSAGYHWGVTNYSGFEKLKIENPLFLKRIKIERYINFDWFRSQLLFPQIFAKASMLNRNL
jgi:hypothetical protein